MPNGRDKVPPTIYLSVDDKIIETKELPEDNKQYYIQRDKNRISTSRRLNF